MVNDFTIQENTQEYTVDFNGDTISYDVLLLSGVSAGAVDVKDLKVSGTDTTSNFLSTKLVGSGDVVTTILNPGADESLDFSVDVSANADVIASVTHITSSGIDHTFIDQDITTTASPTFIDLNSDSIKLSTTAPTITDKGTIWWNDSEYTINVETGLGATIQVGQEMFILFANDTGVEIANGKILHPVSGTVVGGVIVPTVELADASRFETCQGTLFVATHSVANGTVGLGTIFGKVRDVDTTPFGAGAQVWLSDVSPGDFISTQPEFPSYVLSMGGTLNSSLTGEVFINQTTRVEDTFINGWDGSIRETFDFRVTSDGVTVTGTLTNPDTGKDLTAIFSDGNYRIDVTTVPRTITLTPGTDTNPIKNYVYLDKADKTIKVSTADDWPVDIEHARIAQVDLRSALATQTDGALGNQNTNDHIKTNNDNGHHLHGWDWIRDQPATWKSGCLGSSVVTGTPSEVYVSSLSGVVRQFHRQNWLGYNTQTGDHLHVVNDSIEPFKTLDNLATLTLDSLGNTLANRSFSFVLWGIQNKSGEQSHLMLNLPSGSYSKNNPINAVNDADSFSVYSIPDAYKSKGFLIARFTYVLQADGTTWSLYDTQDLRGFQPSNAAGGSSSAPQGLMPSYTTTERNALTPQNGQIIYNTTTLQFEFYENGTWVTK